MLAARRDGPDKASWGWGIGWSEEWVHCYSMQHQHVVWCGARGLGTVEGGLVKPAGTRAYALLYILLMGVPQPIY